MTYVVFKFFPVNSAKYSTVGPMYNIRIFTPRPMAYRPTARMDPV